ncbi:MAG TPA: dihydropteroate synthase [Brevundimonas sp.]|nr:dihydropteroate synthase [Brevundimonas sp.]
MIHQSLVKPPLVMGILNVTPDSFSDGGRHATIEAALAHALRLIDQGADVLDIGGESTRPGSDPVDEADEIARVAPLIAAISARWDGRISIDTMKPGVARAAVAAGATMWNDVTALSHAPDSLATAAELGCEVVLMHMKGAPKTMQDDPRYDDVVAEVVAHLAARAEAAMAAGVAREKAAIFEGLAPGGIAVVNAADVHADIVRQGAEKAGAVVRTFGHDAGCDARLLDFVADSEGATVTAELDGRRIEYRLAQSGVHWGLNSLCVILMLQALDVSLDTALQALAGFQPLAGRGQMKAVKVPGGAFTLIDESYNANPLSMKAGFVSLSAKPVGQGGRRVVVLTDMLELGEHSRALHEGLAPAIVAAGLDLVHTAGPQMRLLHDALPPSLRGEWRETAAELAAEVALLVRPGDVVMVKGSNGSKASLVAAALANLGVAEQEARVAAEAQGKSA